MKISVKMAIITMAIILFLAPTALTVSAQPSGMGAEKGHVRSFIEPILIGHGFALHENEYHILDVNAVKMSDVSPGFIRSLFYQKKTPEEIAKAINNAENEMKTKAHLRFAGQAYSLNITHYDNQTLTGDVLTFAPSGIDQTSFIPDKVGNISLTLKKYEGDVLSTGNLMMNGTNYNVLLTSPLRFENW
jgi:hypothetical protein